MRKPEPIEPIVFLLTGLIVFFSILVIFCEHYFSMDGQIFTVFTGLLGSIAGAFLMRIKPKATSSPSDDTDQDVTVTTVSKPKDKVEDKKDG